MDNNTKRGFRMPKSRLGKIVINLLVTLLFGLAYFYVTLPALNLHSPDSMALK